MKQSNQEMTIFAQFPFYSLDTVTHIENTRFTSFDVKFTRQGFENTC